MKEGNYHIQVYNQETSITEWITLEDFMELMGRS